jgi:hypothetical protein
MDNPHHEGTSTSADILEGYTVLEVKGLKYLVPDFAVSDVRMKLDAEARCKQLGADTNSDQVCDLSTIDSLDLADLILPATRTC